MGINNDSHDKKMEKRHADGLNFTLLEDSEWADQLTKNLRKDFRDQRIKKPKRDKVGKALPDELVEKILAMVPFPYVFKASVLSKSWLARLSPVSSQKEAEKKHLAISFQKRIREQSINWKTFCPVLTWTYCPAYKEYLLSPVLTAYNRTSHTWLKLPSLSFLPENLRNSNNCYDCVQQIEGALLLLSDGYSQRLYVANILTRSWRELPPCPHAEDGGGYWGKPYLSHTSEKYKVIMVYEENWHIVNIYDSNSAAWTSVDFPQSICNTLFVDGCEQIAHMDGVFYFITVHRAPMNPMLVNSLQVLAVNVIEETQAEEFDEFKIVAEINNMSWIESIDRVEKVFLTSNLLILIVETHTSQVLANGFPCSKILQVVKIDLQSQKVVGMAPSPPLRVGRFREWTTDNDFIFTYEEPEGGKALDGDRVIAYNVHEDKWVSLPYHTTMDQTKIPNLWAYKQELKKKVCERRVVNSFRPGLNPFFAV